MKRLLPASRHVGKLLLLGLSTAILIGTLSDNHPERTGIITPEETQIEILRRLASVDPNSPEAAELRRTLSKVRSKAAGNGAEEDPSAFLEGMAELKTTLNGGTYDVGYRDVELKKAIARRQELKGKAALAGEKLPWVQRGPGNVSGRSRAIALDPSDPSGNTWFVATVGGGVWKTTDAGGTWQDKSPEMITYTAMTIAIAESNPNVIYVGTGMGYGRVADITGSGVWKSTDRGESWFQLQSTAQGQVLGAINRLIVDPSDENIVLLCSNNSFSHLFANQGDPSKKSGIFRSTDGGSSWSQVFNPVGVLPANTDNRIQQIIATPGNFNVQYAAVNEVGVLKSTDAGKTWSISANNFALPSDIGTPAGGWTGLGGISVRTELAVSPTDPNRVYGAVERPSGVADLFMSTDAGANWTLVNDNGGDPNWFNANGASGAVAYSAGWFDNTITISPYDENEVIVGGVNIYKITVDPATNTRTTVPLTWWTVNQQGIPVVHADHHFLVTIPVDASAKTYRIVDANDGGVALSTDAGVTWRQSAGGMQTSQFYGVDKKPGENAYIGGMQDNNSWFSPTNPDQFTPWNFAAGGDGCEAVWHYHDPNLMLVTQQYGNLLRSNNGGQLWTLIPAAKISSGQFITKMANSKADPNMVYTLGPGGVGRSDDFGLTWQVLPLPQNWIGYRPFSNIEASIADPYTVWVSSILTNDRVTGTPGGVHVSRDGGLSYTNLTANLPSGLTEASGIATHPTDPKTAYLLFATPGAPKILRTTNLGESWEDISGFAGGSGTSNRGFPDVGVFSLLVMPYNTDVMWAGTEIGLFETNDGGATWVYADNGFPRVTAFEMKIVDGQIVTATYGRGIWTVDLPQLANYRPPVVTLIPRLEKLSLTPQGVIDVMVDLPSSYDSANVTVDGQVVERFDQNADPQKMTVTYPASTYRLYTVNIAAWKGGRQFTTAPKQVLGFPTTPRTTFAADFSQPEDTVDFAMAGFSSAQPAGFSNGALHTAHPYPVSSQIIALLRYPVRVDADPAKAVVSFDEVVLVEEGVGTWPNANFFDYCIVEGTKDGCTWVPLVLGYDSRDQSSWSAAFQSGLQGNGSSTTPGNESMYVKRRVNLLDSFAPGDLIFLRWRLESDPAAVAWGWTIDNIEVQPEASGVAGERLAGRNRHLQLIGPNPFHSVCRAEVVVGERTEVRAEIFDLTGRRVALLQDGALPAGSHLVEWSGENSTGEKAPDGRYILRVTLNGERGEGVTESTALLLLR
ncbi:MAG: hypothetical protein KDD67_15495 [Ignavibacteriae bacterium]|nr:hypothetical protein [Ignavibacteriota bacterium]MCB9215774.1 hypothetical protein [Ignavibacteria bacterium]